MKRIISLALSMVLLVACLALPVMAEGTDGSPFIELLDYGYPIGWSSYTYSLPGDSFSIYFGNPTGGPLRYVDFLFETDSTSIKIATYSCYLNVMSLGNGLFRAYGFLKPIKNDLVDLLATDYDGSYITLLSVRVSYFVVDPYDLNVSAKINAMGYPNQIFNITYPDSPYGNWTYESYDQYEGANTFGMFKSEFRFSDWKKYDYIDLQLGLIVAEVNSVSAYIGEQIVSLEVSYIENADQVGNYYLHIRADLSGFNRDTSDVFTIVVNGSGHFQVTNQLNIYDACGFVVLPEPSLWNHWFTNLQGWLSSGFSSVTSALSTLGTNIGGFISNQTTAIGSAIVSHQQALIDAQKSQHEADRQLWNTISSNVGTWISNQTTAITNSLSTINTSITTFRTNVGTWFTNQTTSITSSISSWGQSIIDSITSGADRIVAALSPNGSAEDFNDKVQQQGNTLEDMAGAMGAVTRPDVSTAIPDISGYLTVTGPVTLASVFDPFWNNSYILRLLLGSLAVSLAFVVIYGGKK